MRRRKAGKSAYTELSMSKAGVRVSMPASDASAVGQQLGQIFSPVVESAGLLGDYVRYFRQAAAIRAMTKVRKVAERNGIRLKPVAVKTLVPWIEAVSLEEPGSSLIDWWAHLLVSATCTSIPPYYIDLMKRVDADQAKFLESLWRKFAKFGGPGSPRMMFNVINEQINDLCHVIEEYRRNGLSNEKIQSRIFPKAKRWVGRVASNGVLVVLTINFFKGKHGPWCQSGVGDVMMLGDSLRDLCLAERLLERRDIERRGDDWAVEANVTLFSDLGVDFMTACRPAGKASSRKKSSSDQRL